MVDSRRGFAAKPLWALAMLIGVLGTAASASAESVTIAPSRWILPSATGECEDIQAVIRVPLAAGIRVIDFIVTMAINGELISETSDGYYCYTDANLLADFDREEVFANSIVRSLAGSTVTVTITGSLTTVDADGVTTHTQCFAGSAVVSIVNPSVGGR